MLRGIPSATTIDKRSRSRDAAGHSGRSACSVHVQLSLNAGDAKKLEAGNDHLLLFPSVAWLFSELLNGAEGGRMADIFNAYKHLVHTYKLDLSDLQIARAERAFRLKFMEEMKFRTPATEAGDWEFFAYVAPRKTFSRPDLAAELDPKKKA
jgi:hypothetical protein